MLIWHYPSVTGYLLASLKKTGQKHQTKDAKAKTLEQQNKREKTPAKGQQKKDKSEASEENIGTKTEEQKK